jgi:pimeloyl-ACP methyl ester carboxylesterase
MYTKEKHMHIIYLHGFASSPLSKKAQFFREPLEARGATYAIPDLNAPSFQRLMLTAMLERTAQAVREAPDGDVALVGSSMGGLTAVNFLERYAHAEAQRVTRLVLLAPAFEFLSAGGGDERDAWLAKWREDGAMPFFNYATNGEQPVHYQLVQDVAGYDSYAVTWQTATRIYHGENDDTVSPQQSQRFAKERDHVDLHILPTDHQMLDHTDVLLAGIIDFWGL